MILERGLHLAYCTNIHRGQSWAEMFAALNTHTLAVRDRVASGRPYAIGLRLSAQAARELSDPQTLLGFQRWLERQHCYVFTINGFPYGQFHGARVKEQVYAPDWTTSERLEFTNLLFDILAQLVPEGVEGSVSTVPGSFKEFISSNAQVQAMHAHLWQCVDHIARLSQRSGRRLHLGLEPEPLCYLETTAETAQFFDQLRDVRPGDDRWREHLGVNYDTCHLAVEYEEPAQALARLQQHHIKLSKVHLSSALKVVPTPDTLRALQAFADDIYFHQVIERGPDQQLRRYRDLDVALRQGPFRLPHHGKGPAGTNDKPSPESQEAVEWRIHFHIPLHSQSTPLFGNTADHLLGLLDILQRQPHLCAHLEMETYTWEVMPEAMKNRSVVDQLVSEYAWTLTQLRARGLAQAPPGGLH